MSRAIAAALSAGLLALAGTTPARAQLTPAYPAAFDAGALRGWLAAATQLRAEQVVAVTRTALSAIVEGPFEQAGFRRVWVRSEALDPQVVASQGAMSWQTPVDVDCASRRVRQGATTGHRYRNLVGQGVVLSPQDGDWREPGPRTQLENVWRAVCDPSFRPPLGVAPTPAAVRGRAPEVQLASLAAAADAERLLGGLRARFGPLLEGRSATIHTAQVDGRAWFRVRVRGFRDAAEAAAFCRQLIDGGQACVRVAAGPAKPPAVARKPARPVPANPARQPG